MQHTLVAVFDNRGDAQKALEDLVASGFSRSEVSLSEGDPNASGADSGTTIAGSIKGFFSNLFGSDDNSRAHLYSEAVTRGHYVLTLTAATEPEVERAADIVERYGPVDIEEQAEQWASGAMASEAIRMGNSAQQGQSMSQQSAQGAMQGGSQGPLQGSASSMQGSQQRAADTGTAIPVIQEELKVGKREVQRGGVRIYQRVVETPVNETIGLREEHVNVQRRPVDKMVDPADIAAFQENTLELRETAEEAVVEKTARVVEEVIVGKDVSQRQEQISDTLRRTEVDVEELTPEDDVYFRGHWTSNFANLGGRYEDYAPAYRYGSAMARSDQYRGQYWDDVEGNLRSGWEARNTGSTWDNIKAAVRHGWERITS